MYLLIYNLNGNYNNFSSVVFFFACYTKYYAFYNFVNFNFEIDHFFIIYPKIKKLAGLVE